MSAVFEIHILNKQIIPYHTIEKSLIDLQFKLESIEIMDDWKYNNYTNLHKENLFEIEELIMNSKIVMIKGTLNSLHNCGIFMSLNESQVFKLDLWVSTKLVSFLDSNYITFENLAIYDRITATIIENINKDHLVFCGIGTEIFLPYNSSINEMVCKSRNVYRWIFAHNNKFDCLKNYCKEANAEFTIYSILEK